MRRALRFRFLVVAVSAVLCGSVWGTDVPVSNDLAIRPQKGPTVARSGSAGYVVLARVEQSAGSHSSAFGYQGLACIAKPGDANANGLYSLSDVVAIVNFIFAKPGWPPCPAMGNICWLSGLLCRGDFNGDLLVTLGDVIFGVNFVFGKLGAQNPVGSGECCIPWNAP
jgi:hypothetical protein